MWKNKIQAVCNFAVKHSKIAFPVIVIAAVATTVVIALNAGDARTAEENPAQDQASSAAVQEAQVQTTEEPVSTEVPLLENEDGAIYSLIATYYNAVALGDVDTLLAICDEISERDRLHFQEMSKYIDCYPVLEIYTKAGLEEGTIIAYVYYKVTFDGKEDEFPGYKAHYICTNEQGELYIKRGENSDEVNEYIKTVSAQADVVEFNNRTNAEYNELVAAKPELLEYLSQLDSQVNTAVGVILAQQEAEASQEATTQEAQTGTEGQEATNPETSSEVVEQPTETTAEPVVQYATATTTVNVRSSDSENADKLGKVPGGTKIQVLEQKVNGWSKVLFEGKEGYIKSEFLQMIENADGAETVGTITATTNINVRAAASETADKLGVLAGGDSAELIAKEGDWCKIKYNGQIGYVKAEFVQ